jgi:methionyl-tRNA synthetase
MSDKKRYLITAALPYANGGIHLGHLAGAYLPADIYARFLRLQGKDVLFVCGSDEHGVPITLGARKEGITPKQFVDKYHELMKQSFERFGISFDIYSRTSNKTHHNTAQDFFLTLYHKNVFTEETSQQYYDEQEKIFLADRYITGTCPNCSYEKAYGDQCEKCGTSLSPRELKNPVSVVRGKPPVLKETKHWYLPLNNYEDWLKEWILQQHKDDWKPNVLGQCKSWLDNGLNPRAMTRDLDWGVKVPLPDSEGKVLYVWFDAPIGYISATKEYFDAHPSKGKWEDYWQSEESSLIHFIGKDNIVFHCIIFPTLLKAHGNFILPDNVPANEFLNLEGDKLSTSRGWAVWLHEYLDDMPGKQDVLRYVLTSTAPETKDNDFTWKDFQARNNNELAAILGNLVNRAFVLTHKYFDGKVPAYIDHSMSDAERDIIYQTNVIKKNIENSVQRFRFREALNEAMNLVRLGNKYLTDTEPWKKYNTDTAATGHILNFTLQLIANSAILLDSFLPNTADKIYSMLNLSPKLSWNNVGNFKCIHEGHILNKPEILFAKIEDSDIQKQIDKLHERKKQMESVKPIETAQKPVITYDDFSKMELRIGKIEHAEKVKNADKLLQLRVNMGNETRTIVSGIAAHYTPEQVIGQQVCVVCNLAPRKIKGIESKGMILMAEDADGALRFVMPSAEVANGSGVS